MSFLAFQKMHSFLKALENRAGLIFRITLRRDSRRLCDMIYWLVYARSGVINLINGAEKHYTLQKAAPER
jgi:hypothetical protein